MLVTSHNGRALPAVLESVSDEQLRAAMVDAAREVFGASPIGAVPASGAGPTDPGLVTELADAVRVPNVIPELRCAATALWTEPDDEWVPWIRKRFLTTLAAAVVDAIQNSCPEVDVSDIRCDLDVLTPDGDHVMGRIHISEDQPGGVGVVEALVDRYIEDPRSFWSLVTAGLGPCDGERVDWNLRQFLAKCGDSSIAQPATRIRTATDLTSLTSAWRDLRSAMFDLGLDGDQSIVSALATRVLRPRSNHDLETLVSGLLQRWDEVEASLGIEVELRVFAHLAASSADVRRRLRALHGRAELPGWEIGQIVGLLWPRGDRVRSAALQTYSPYVCFEPSERLFFEDITAHQGAVVHASSADWRNHVDDALRVDGSAVIRAGNEGIAAAAIRDLLTEPTNVEVLEFHPRVVGVARSTDGLDVLVELREARQ